MTTTININLAGRAFKIDEDACEILRSYLDSIERNLSADDIRDVMRDIEARIAELFTDLCRSERAEVVSKEMVRAVMDQLGKPDDFKEDDETADNTVSKILHRKMYRDTNNKIIAGVCSGLGHWFGIDAIWVRLIFLLCLLLWGATLPIYLVLWLIMPEAQTAAQRLDMRGELPTVENIEREFETEKTSNSSSSSSNNGCLLTAVKIVVIGIGLFFLFIAGIVFFAVITALVGAMSGIAAASPLGLVGAFFTHDYMLGTILALLLVIVICLPLFCLVKFILDYANNNKRMSGRSIMFAILIWFAALVGSVTIGIYELTQNENIIDDIITWVDRHDGDDSSAPAETITNEPFRSIVAEGAMSITLTQAGECYAEGEKTYLKEAEVRDGVLYLTSKEGTNKTSHLWIQVTDLQSIRLAGATRCNTPDMLNAENLEIELLGASSLDLKINTQSLSINAEGASDIDLEGKAERLTIEVEGASRVEAEELVAATAKAKAEGTCKVELNVTDRLEAYPTAMSKITYKGNPEVLSKTDGMGKVKKIER